MGSYSRKRKNMFAKLARLLTPRAAGAVVLVAAAIAAALVATVGGSSAGSSAAPRRLGAVGAVSASSSASGASASVVGSGPIVSKAIHHDLSPPLRTLKPVVVPVSGPQLTPDAGEGHQFAGGVGGPDAAVQSAPGATQTPSPVANFEGVAVGQGGNWAPPDPNGTVGPNNYFEIVNDGIAIFSKTGSIVYGPVPTNTLWSGFGGGCQTNNDGDGTVSYDQFASRWIVSQFSVSSTPYLQCVAVSQTSDPTGAYYRYAFSYGNTDFNDYPKLGVWPDAYYTTYNIYANGENYTGPEVCALDRAKMDAGLAATQQCFKLGSNIGTLMPSTVDGPTPPPGGSPNFVLSMATNSLQLWKFHVDWATPANTTLSGPQQFSVASFTKLCPVFQCVPQPGTSQKLDSLGDRLMYRLAYRNFGDHESLVVAHSVALTARGGMRWYEIRSPNTAPTVYQQSTYAPDNTWRWMGSVAMDHVGDMALGYAVSSSSVRPGVRYTGRLVGDPLNTMGSEVTIVSGTGSQIDGLERWGDYTSMSIDPSDDCTFWYVGEYLTSDGNWNWHTRIGSFRFPSCTSGGGSPPVVSSFTPTSGPVGTNVDVTGSAFTGATAVTFGGVAATTFHVDSATELHATVPTGAQTGPIAVTTPGGTGASASTFTVTSGGGGNAPTVTSFTPTSGPVGANVSITGTGFTGVTAVTFNGTASTNVTFNSDTSVTARVPTGASTGPIAVTTPNGTGTSSTSFTVTAATGRPTISSFTPTSGRRGIQVKILGNNFAGATTVRLGLVTAAFTVDSNTQITATVPSTARVGTQSHWSVTGPGGTGTSIGYFRVTG
jgi:hypothetical protein